MFSKQIACRCSNLKYGCVRDKYVHIHDNTIWQVFNLYFFTFDMFV